MNTPTVTDVDCDPSRPGLEKRVSIPTDGTSAASKYMVRFSTDLVKWHVSRSRGFPVRTPRWSGRSAAAARLQLPDSIPTCSSLRASTTTRTATGWRRATSAATSAPIPLRRTRTATARPTVPRTPTATASTTAASSTGLARPITTPAAGQLAPRIHRHRRRRRERRDRSLPARSSAALDPDCDGAPNLPLNGPSNSYPPLVAE